ncbi:hypothetical protein Nepgr_015969 [Nepenthes gracilis]|uniref:Receptor-like serine/threonine-protein kinase n=1 Tax=Nepenthes gracilis TaxID=150966 RepID=A0AAD3XR70_NEPGR|nr:hypothetical protein Nepgr_015969 [Nepenthes gracilis]
MKIENYPWIKISFVSLCFLLLTPLYHGADTITSSHSLSGDQTIVSAGHIFELGFFQPGSSSNYYIGIWYKQDPGQAVVWVANRDDPISDKQYSELKILNGNLVLTNEFKTPIWFTNSTSTTTKSTEAVIQDDGNLVLRDEHNSTIWQSFDHPTHTWLPSMKLGIDKKTRKVQRLTAWKNKDDPATGLFSLEPDPDGTSQYYLLRNETEEYWSSGTWDAEQQIFTLIPEIRQDFMHNYGYVDNENESYFIYSEKDPSTISRIFVDVCGQIKVEAWLADAQKWNLFWMLPRKQCEVYAYCGAFGICNQNSLPFCNCLRDFEPTSQSDWNLNDYSRGCARKNPLNCGNHTAREVRDGFYPYLNMRLPEHAQSVAAASLEGCQLACLNNCSCTAYAYDGGDRCSIWIGDLLNMTQLSDGDVNGKTLYVKQATSKFSSSNKRMIVGGAVGVIAMVIMVLCLLFIWKQKRKKRTATKTVEGAVIAFRYKDLQNTTKNFSEKLGGGGFGSVFKGTLPDFSIVAVKKLESISQGEKQFRTEISTIGTIQHVNLIRLRGFCSEGARKLLVYDYMPNGSLDNHLFHEKDSEVLNWETRYKIAVGIAKGLTYLHEKCRSCIIHCDIKPENILLDAEFCVKITDFGLAKLVGREFSRVLTTMRGTRGYLAPEWISGVAITAKADVYSYGMMLFELLSGHRNMEQLEDGKVKFFPNWVATKIIKGGEDILSILDDKLKGNGNREEVMKICQVAYWCIQDGENHRPSMGQVVQILEGVLDVSMPPIPRSLQVFLDNQEHILYFTKSSSSQSS